MKISQLAFVSFLCFIGLSVGCKTGGEKNPTLDSSYTKTELLEIARIANLEEGKYTGVFQYTEGKAIIYRNDSVGFINYKGVLTIMPTLKSLQPFQNGIAEAHTRKDIPCFIDTTGKIVKMFPNYQFIINFDNEPFTEFWHKNGKFGLMDKTFKEVIPAKYTEARFFKQGLFLVKLGEKWGAVDQNDKTVIPFIYDRMEYMDDAGRIMASKGKGWGFIDKDEKVIVPFVFYSLFAFKENKTNFIDQATGKYGFIDSKGNQIVGPIYDFVNNFSNGMAKVGMRDTTGNNTPRIGFIDSTGKEIISLQYFEADDFSNGFALVKDSLGSCYINKRGDRILPKIDTYNNILYPFENGFAKIELESKEVIYMDRFQRLLKVSDLKQLRDESLKY